MRKAELSDEADSENYLGGSSETMYFIGLDVHKKTISYCVRMRLAVRIWKARSDQAGASWTAGSGHYPNPG